MTNFVEHSSSSIVYFNFKDQNPTVRVTNTPSIEVDARRTWETEGYVLPKIGEIDCDYPERNIRRKGSLISGAGFFDVILISLDRRLVYYGPGEYVLPHLHNEKEIFKITTGNTHVWLWNDFKGEWDYFFKQKDDEIEIDAGIPHCLIAGDDGLSMFVSRNDNTRSVEWQTQLELPNLFADAIKALSK